MKLDSDTLTRVGIVHPPYVQFVEAITEDHPATAMALIPKLTEEDLLRIPGELSAWLDKLCRVKFSVVRMKSVHEIAREVGEDKATVESLQRQVRKYELPRINQLALTISSTDKALSQGYRDGVLELMVSNWR